MATTLVVNPFAFGTTLNPQTGITSATLKGWYDASQETDANGTAMGTITDRSTYGKNLTQGTAGAKPTIETAADGKRYYNFDGTDDQVTAAAASDWQFLHDAEAAVFVVVELDAHSADGRSTILDTGGLSTSNTGIWLAFDNRGGAGNAGPNGVQARANRSTGTAADNFQCNSAVDTCKTATRHLLAVRAFSTSNATLWINRDRNTATLDSSVTFGGTTPLGPLRLGMRTSGTALPMNGRIYEVLCYDGTLSSGDLDLLFDYLAAKWNLSVWDDSSSNPVTISSGTTYRSFPTLAKAANGDLLVVAREGTSHTSTFGDLLQWRSTTRGTTWGSSTTIFDGATENLDLRDPGLTKLDNGTLLLTCSVRNAAGTASIVDGCRWATSTDNGSTWSALSTLNDAFAGFSRCSTRPCQLPNGDLLWPIYGNDIGDGNTTRWIKVYKSTDNASSWSYLADIGASGDAKGWGEPNIVYEPNTGTLIALLRDTNGADLYRSTSTDSGATWSAPSMVQADANSSPQACFSPRGALVLGQRITTDSNYGYLLTSVDQGVTWSRGERWSNLGDHEYASPIVDSDNIVIAWAREASSSDADVFASIYTEY